MEPGGLLVFLQAVNAAKNVYSLMAVGKQNSTLMKKLGDDSWDDAVTKMEKLKDIQGLRDAGSDFGKAFKFFTEAAKPGGTFKKWLANQSPVWSLYQEKYSDLYEMATRSATMACKCYGAAKKVDMSEHWGDKAMESFGRYEKANLLAIEGKRTSSTQVGGQMMQASWSTTGPMDDVKERHRKERQELANTIKISVKGRLTL